MHHLPPPFPLPLVIVNPVSRGGRGARDWAPAASVLRSQFGAFECRFTERPGHATRIARQEAEQGRRLILTFGGDGTISETARGILDSGQPCALGILPHGTGGDLIRSLPVPRRLADAARAFRRGRTLAIDVGRVVFDGGRESSFVNSASFGLSGEVARRMNLAHRGGKGRRNSYLAETLKAAVEFRVPEVAIDVDGSAPRRAAITTVSIHNGRYFGGGMKMAPEASLTDGRLDVIVVKKLPFLKLAIRSPLLYWGGHLGLAEVEHGRALRLSARPVDLEARVPVEIDGEASEALPARFEIRPGALRVLLPPA